MKCGDDPALLKYRLGGVVDLKNGSQGAESILFSTAVTTHQASSVTMHRQHHNFRLIYLLQSLSVLVLRVSRTLSSHQVERSHPLAAKVIGK